MSHETVTTSKRRKPYILIEKNSYRTEQKCSKQIILPDIITTNSGFLQISTRKRAEVVVQKQLTRDVPRKRYSENIKQIYMRTPKL